MIDPFVSGALFGYLAGVAWCLLGDVVREWRSGPPEKKARPEVPPETWW